MIRLTGVANFVEQRIQTHVRDVWDGVVYAIALSWRQKRTSVRRNKAHMDSVKNNATFLLTEPNNAAIRHYLLPPNTYPSYLSKLGIAQENRLNIHMLEMRPNNIGAPLVLDQPLFAYYRFYVPIQRGNQWNSAFFDQPWLQCISVFFIPDKSKEFVHFCHFNSFWNRGIRYLFGVGLDP